MRVSARVRIPVRDSGSAHERESQEAQYIPLTAHGKPHPALGDTSPSRHAGLNRPRGLKVVRVLRFGTCRPVNRKALIREQVWELVGELAHEMVQMVEVGGVCKVHRRVETADVVCKIVHHLRRVVWPRLVGGLKGLQLYPHRLQAIV